VEESSGGAREIEGGLAGGCCGSGGEKEKGINHRWHGGKQRKGQEEGGCVASAFYIFQVWIF
jgi:hypothetical protein